MQIITQGQNIFFIYKVTNLKNNKIYIGKTSGPNPEKRFYNHKKFAFCKSARNDCPKLYRSIRKYGADNFTSEIIKSVDNEQLAYELEANYIKEYNSIKKGMNVLVGGKGAVSGELNPMYGKGYLIAGNKNGMFGKTGELNPFYGKKHTKETLDKIKKQNRKLSDNDVISIKEMLYNKIGYKIISEKYNISFAIISRIKNDIRYKDIDTEFKTTHSSHVSEKDVEEILMLWFKNNPIKDNRNNCKQFYLKEVYGKFNITINKLRRILKRDTWKHIYDKCCESSVSTSNSNVPSINLDNKSK